MRKKHNGQVRYVCSKCESSFNTGESDRRLSWHAARQEGWVILKHAGAWLHFCSWICRNAFERGESND